MKIIANVFHYLAIFGLIFFASCAGQNGAVPYIIPEQENNTKPDRVIEAVNILETQDGYGAENLPNWLSVYINSGIEELEKTDILQNKYYFISRNEGANLNALNKWANNYSPSHDFPRLASARIEEKMISAATLYPDNEYGVFFEALVKKALGSEYPEAVKEDIFWIKTINNQAGDYSEKYEYFVILSVEKTNLQTHIANMMSEVLSSVNPTRAQSAAISRLQQAFFEGF